MGASSRMRHGLCLADAASKEIDTGGIFVYNPKSPETKSECANNEKDYIANPCCTCPGGMHHDKFSQQSASRHNCDYGTATGFANPYRVLAFGMFIDLAHKVKAEDASQETSFFWHPTAMTLFQ